MRTFSVLPLVLLVACSSSATSDFLGGGSHADTASGSYDADSDTDTDADADTDYGDQADTGRPSSDSGDTDTDTEGTPCEEEEPVRLYISPDDSNSMGSAVLGRNAVLEGWGSAPQAPIRVHEIFNYYEWDYPAAELESLRVTPSLEKQVDGTWILQLGISSPPLGNDNRQPMNLVFSLDTSGSMAGGPMEDLKDTMRAIAGSLRYGDLVSVVDWSETPSVSLRAHPVSGADDATLLATVDALTSNGGTNLEGGLERAYELAEANYSDNRINRVVLISDGGANIGVTSEEVIGRYAGSEFRAGVYLAGVGVGTGRTYNDDLMDEVTDLGKGASTFVDNATEAWRVFGESRFVEQMDVAARNVRVTLDLPPGFSIGRSSAEEYSTDPTQIEPQNIAPSDSVVIFNRLDTCAPEQVSGESTVGVTLNWQDPATLQERSMEQSWTFAELLAADGARIAKGKALYTYGQALAAWQSGRRSETEWAVDLALVTLEAAEQQNPGDDALEEVRLVLEVLD